MKLDKWFSINKIHELNIFRAQIYLKVLMKKLTFSFLGNNRPVFDMVFGKLWIEREENLKTRVSKTNKKKNLKK